MDKQNEICVCVYIYMYMYAMEYYLTLKRNDTWYKMNEPRKYFAKWYGPVTKGQVFYDFNFMRYPE